MKFSSWDFPEQERSSISPPFLKFELIMMKGTTSIYLATLLFLTIACSFSAPTSLAQQMIFRSSDDGSMAIMAIPGGMLIVEGQEEARVRRSMAPAQSGTEIIDIKEGDLIIFLDGTRITAANQLNELYEKVEIGTEVKLGIQRGENKMIRAFKKPELQENYTSTEGNGARVMSFTTDGPANGDLLRDLENPGMWPAGFFVGEKDGEVIVASIIPLPNKAEALSGIKEGDVIVSLDGTAITSVKQLNKAYEEILVSDDVTLEIKHQGNTEKLMFKKPEPPQMRMQFRSN